MKRKSAGSDRYQQQDNAAISDDQAGRSSGSPVQCPDGVLTPRDMVGYLRAAEDGMSVPPEVEEHLEKCSGCRADWEFISLTDPILRESREKRVDLMIREVTIDDEIEKVDEISSNLHTIEHQRLVNQVEAELLGSRVTTEDEWVKTAFAEISECTPDTVLELCRRVQSIVDDARRYVTAKQVARRFDMFTDRHLQREAKIGILASLLLSNSKSIDLSQIGAPLAIAAALAASLPQTTYFRDAKVLEKSNDTILFHCGHMQKLLREFDIVRSTLEPRISAQSTR